MAKGIELSAEFFPPFTPVGEEKLRIVRQKLYHSFKPDFFSVTCGAGGATEERTSQTIQEICQEGVTTACPHMTCIGMSQHFINKELAHYQKLGVTHLTALRGDLPSGSYGRAFFHYASDLVEFIRSQTQDHFHIKVAAYPEYHPQSHTAENNLQALKHKMQAGANSAITQFFFNADAYWFFVDDAQKQGIDIPIIPGIMPIIHFENLARFADNCGADIPRWIRFKMESYKNDQASMDAFGLDIVSNLCQRLLNNGAPGLHFYSMNQADAIIAIIQRLGLQR